MKNIVSAVFDDPMDAQRAVDWLRDQGVSPNAMTVVQQHDDRAHAGHGAGYDDDEAADDAADAGKGALTGLGVGAGVGALFGLAAAAIPGVGPFIAAGALAEVLGVAGGAAVAGAVVGGTSGALAGALSNWGLNENEANYYAGRVERGGTYVGVDASATTLSRDDIADVFRRYNGDIHTA